MHWIKLSVFTLLLLLVTIPHPRVNSQRKDLAYDLWLVRSQTLTAELIKDGDNLETSHAVFFLQSWLNNGGVIIPRKRKLG